MSTYERKTEITDKRIPKGCTVMYHEIRGYDSPDRWYEAHRGKVKLGEFGTKEAAIAVFAEGKSKSRYDREIL